MSATTADKAAQIAARHPDNRWVRRPDGAWALEYPPVPAIGPGKVVGFGGDGSPQDIGYSFEHAVTWRWWDLSWRPHDYRSLVGGFVVSRLEAVTDDERVVAYLNVVHTNKDVCEAYMPTIWHYADEHTGRSFPTGEDADPRKAWLRAWQHLARTNPRTIRRATRSVLEVKDAPTDEVELFTDLAKAVRLLRAERDQWVASLRHPQVDYAWVDEDRRRRGLGRDMYMMCAAHLASMDMMLCASGVQSDEAKALWAALVADPTIPTREVSVTVQGYRRKGTHTYLALDLRAPLGDTETSQAGAEECTR